MLNIILAISTYYFLHDSENIKMIRKELDEKNENLNKKKQILENNNNELNEIIEDKNKIIREKNTISDNYKREISNLKNEIIKVKNFKNSEMFNNLLDCKRNYDDLTLNCIKIEEQNNKYELSLNLCINEKKDYEDVIRLQGKIIDNKNIEIGLEIEKNFNLRHAMEKIIITSKKPKFFKIALNIVIGVGAGYLISKL